MGVGERKGGKGVCAKPVSIYRLKMFSVGKDTISSRYNKYRAELLFFENFEAPPLTPPPPLREKCHIDKATY